MQQSQENAEQDKYFIFPLFNMGSNIKVLKNDIKDLMTHFKRLEADIAVVKNVNDKLVERLMETEKAVLEKWSVLAT